MNERNVKMGKIAIAGLFVASLVLLTGVVFAPPFGPPPGLNGSPRSNGPPGLNRFDTKEAGKLVVRYPQKAVKDKPFNIGIYISDDAVGGSDYESATMKIDVSGPAGATIVGWNSWFEAQGLFIEWGVSDLIVEPVTVDGVIYESFEHDDSVSKLDDVPGWTGSIVCKADTAGTYTFTIGSWTFDIDVSI